MTKEPKDMDAKEFARHWLGPYYGDSMITEHAVGIIAARDRRILEDAHRRFKDAWAAHKRFDDCCAAILGEPRFQPGQLVRQKKDHPWNIVVWKDDGCMRPEAWEPFLDRDGKPVFAKVGDDEVTQ
jgi:hypothetical protein